MGDGHNDNCLGPESSACTPDTIELENQYAELLVKLTARPLMELDVAA